jgi:hypothetical protein
MKGQRESLAEWQRFVQGTGAGLLMGGCIEAFDHKYSFWVARSAGVRWGLILTLPIGRDIALRCPPARAVPSSARRVPASELWRRRIPPKRACAQKTRPRAQADGAARHPYPDRAQCADAPVNPAASVSGSVTVCDGPRLVQSAEWGREKRKSESEKRNRRQGFHLRQGFGGQAGGQEAEMGPRPPPAGGDVAKIVTA